MKIYLLLIFLLTGSFIYAQVPEDAIRYSFYPQSGTARNMAIGGAMGSLGGDINATFVNPAGLGLYKTNEFVITPAFSFNNNKATFRG
ncbi:MAG: aromatic hydrocarbon degradation protein, partial [Ferruginibacter sp.]